MKTSQSMSPVEAKNHVSMRCPACHKHGLFHPMYGAADITWTLLEPKRKLVKAETALEELTNALSIPATFAAGMRRCPNSLCQELVFVVQRNGELSESFPPEPLDIDLNGVPDAVADSLDEAVRCHSAGCYRAAALMVRRALEELCADKGAKGKDLRSRLDALRTAIVISAELLEAAHELRILGNDAAHLEGRAYDDISDIEVEVAIELTQELIKAVYQHSALVAKMRALKKSPARKH